MIQESAYLLGRAFALLTQCRNHLIITDDLDGVKLIEDEYQSLSKDIEKVLYKGKE